MISVLLNVYNVEKHISECVKSLLDQTISEYEIVIIDDASTDNTRNIIEAFYDRRIRFFENKENLGIARSRNRCVELSRGENILFTDGDCVVAKNWIEQALEFLEKRGCVGVEGRTYYVSEDYEPTYSDHVVKNEKPGNYMTCNMAYEKSVVDRVEGFDWRYTGLSDRDLALRVKRFGKILFNPEMIVYHQKVTFKPLQFVRWGSRIRNRVLLYKKFGEKPFSGLRIVRPQNLMAIMFPPLVFASFLRNRYKKKEDFSLFPFIYIKLIYERLSLWEMCARERVLMI